MPISHAAAAADVHAAANLTAKSISDSCIKAPSPRLDQNGTTVLQPGLGQCGSDGYVDQGNYALNQSAPAGTTFTTWRCFNIASGNAAPLAPANNVILQGAAHITCVAVYTLIPTPSPSPSPSPSP